jgi:hypothetical protein
VLDLVKASFFSFNKIVEGNLSKYQAKKAFRHGAWLEIQCLCLGELQHTNSTERGISLQADRRSARQCVRR